MQLGQFGGVKEPSVRQVRFHTFRDLSISKKISSDLQEYPVELRKGTWLPFQLDFKPVYSGG